MNDGEQLSFSVTYRLQEYLAIVRSHALAKATGQGASGFQQFTTRMIVAVVGRIMFAVKSRRVGTCDFTIDETGVTRRSRQGETVVPWSKVTALHAYETGYIIEVGPGGMPVPFRVLSAEQREMLPSMVAMFASPQNSS